LKKIGFVSWALALACRLCTCVHNVRDRWEWILDLGGRCLTTLCAATAIPPALGLAFSTSVGRLGTEQKNSAGFEREASAT